jgi:carboxyl-terminal processing protease
MGKGSYARDFSLLLLLVVVTFLFGYQVASAAPRAIASPALPSWLKSTLQFLRFESDDGGMKMKPEDVELLYEVLDAVGNEYIETNIDPKQVIYGAAMGAVASLGDPYSRFVPPAPGKEMKQDIEGYYSGVGISIEERHGYVVIATVFPESPAEAAGIMSGDIVSSVDGEDVLTAGSLRVVELIRGEEGTSVDIGVMREGEEEELVFTAVRANIKYPSVWETRMLEGNIGYVEVTQFNKETPGDLRESLAQLDQDGARGIILDLRNNAGGPLDAAVYVSDIFIPDGTMVYLLGRDGNLVPDPVDPALRDGGDALGLPLVVLINQFTASASEIVAGAVQDYGVGIVMGQKSFGKGVVQNVIPLNDGSYLVLTTNKYLTPEERDINEVGIEPDVVISLETEDIEDDYIVALLDEMESLSGQIEAKNDELREYLREHDYQLDVARSYLEEELVSG